jgi:hypothetical protein
MILFAESVEPGRVLLVIGRVEEEERVGGIPVADAFAKVEVVDVDASKTVADEADAVVDACPAAGSAAPSTIKSPSFSGITCKRRGDRVGGANCSFDTISVSSLEVLRQLILPRIVQLPAVEEMFAAFEEEKWMVPDRLEKIDELPVEVVVDFDSARGFCEKDVAGATEDFNIDFVRGQKLR